MEAYFLNQVEWGRSQSLYHAAAHLGREALFILRPATPYVCIGYHQDVEQEIDLEYAHNEKLPVFRREVGGGAVYLDSGQLFYQLVLHADRPGIPTPKGAFFKMLLMPVVETFREFGVPAVYKPANDVLAGGRKISGNGAAEIENMNVLVGNFILTFDYEHMSRVLRVPDEKFRDKIYKSLAENLTTMERESGRIPPVEAIASALIRRYETLLGPMEHRSLPDAKLQSEADRLFGKMHTPEWLYQNDRRKRDFRQVKIRDGVELMQSNYKARGGLVRASALQMEGCLHDLHLSGDFFIFPSDSLPALERRLEGMRVDQQAISEAIGAFFLEHGVQAPELTPHELARAIVGQKGRTPSAVPLAQQRGTAHQT
jgi:lipoate-protein ligase A